jgi:hypothetical protein
LPSCRPDTLYIVYMLSGNLKSNARQILKGMPS